MTMNRSLVTLVIGFVLALLVVGFVRWLRSRPVAANSRTAAPAGPPLPGTEPPLPAALEPHRARLETLLAPAARLLPVGEPVARLGGQPRLPDGVAWPASPAHPMSFVGEVDLAALRRAAPDAAPILPAEGRLLLFYDVEEMRWGFEPTDRSFFRLIHVGDGGQSRPAPPGTTAFKERLLGARPVRVLPEAESLPGDVVFDGAAAEAYADYAEALTPAPDHRVGGHPAWIQGDGREDAAIAAVGGSTGSPEQARDARARLAPGPASEWSLVWQIDSDDEAGFMWGDAGRLYILARDQDLREGRLDRAWLVLQCY